LANKGVNAVADKNDSLLCSSPGATNVSQPAKLTAGRYKTHPKAFTFQWTMASTWAPQKNACHTLLNKLSPTLWRAIDEIASIESAFYGTL